MVLFHSQTRRHMINIVYYGIEVLTLLKLSFKANMNFTLKTGKGQP